MAAVMTNITVAHTIIDINVVLTRRGTSTHNTSAVSLLRLRTAQLVSAVTISYPRLAVPALNNLCMTANTIHVSLKHGFIILQHGLNKSNRPPQPSIYPQLSSGREGPVHTSLVDSILVAGQTFHVNLTPSRSSFWLMKSDQVDITDH